MPTHETASRMTSYGACDSVVDMDIEDQQTPNTEFMLRDDEKDNRQDNGNGDTDWRVLRPPQQQNKGATTGGTELPTPTGSDEDDEKHLHEPRTKESTPTGETEDETTEKEKEKGMEMKSMK